MDTTPERISSLMAAATASPIKQSEGAALNPNEKLRSDEILSQEMLENKKAIMEQCSDNSEQLEQLQCASDSTGPIATSNEFSLPATPPTNFNTHNKDQELNLIDVEISGNEKGTEHNKGSQKCSPGTPLSSDVPNLSASFVVATDSPEFVPIALDKPSSLSAWESLAQELMEKAVSWLKDRDALVAKVRLWTIPFLICTFAVLASPKGRNFVTMWVIHPLYIMICQLIGVALGIGLGLGLATHVYDFLQAITLREEQALEQAQAAAIGKDATDCSSRINGQVLPPMQFSLSSAQQRTAVNGSNAINNSSRYHYANIRQPSTSSNIGGVGGVYLEDEQTYASLMQSAGYEPVDRNKKILRGHVLKRDDTFFNIRYKFTPASESTASKDGDGGSKAFKIMRELWPVLPTVINEQLANFIELIMRDFVASWYSHLDGGCIYEDEREKRRKQAEEHQGVEESTKPTPFRAMIHELAPHRPLPLLDTLYETMAIAFGNLATRVEHVNILQIILLKWTRILAHSFKVYRQLRKSVVTKQLSHAAASRQVSANAGGTFASSLSFRSSLTQASAAVAAAASTVTTLPTSAVTTDASTMGNEIAPSEMAMTKEFLFSNKLHRAITFGLDVPSLLFADANGKECGLSLESFSKNGVRLDNASEKAKNFHDWDDKVLEHRLFGTNLLYECELDYNRVVAHRMVRALLPRPDFNSPIVSKLLTELIAGCVLSPTMSCACPQFLNSALIRLLEKKEEDVDVSEQETVEKTNLAKTTSASSEVTSHSFTETDGESLAMPTPAMPTTVNDIDEGAIALKNTTLDSSVVDTAVLVEDHFTATCTDESKEPQFRTSNDSSPEPFLDVLDTPSKASTSSGNGFRLEAGKSGPDSLDMEMAAKAAQSVTICNNASSDDIITRLALTLIDLQRFADFEDIRDARVENRSLSVDWDDAGCRSAILRLVLIIEAALTNGRCTYRLQKEALFDVDEDEDIDDTGDGAEENDIPVEVTLPEYESTTLTQILMELTSDIDAFEKRVATENALVAESKVDRFKDMHAEDYIPTAQEQSTLRTLIAAWLHTGQLFRTATVLVQAHATVLAPYYKENAFLRNQANAAGFVRQLRALDGVDIMVDTMAVLASPRLNDTNNEEINALINKSARLSSLERDDSVITTSEEAVSPSAASTLLATQYMLTSSTPRFLDFHRNESFAASLRAERERRMQSWEAMTQEESEGSSLSMVCRTRGSSEVDIAAHKELHYLARIFYNGTNLLAIRDAARRKQSHELTPFASDSGTTASVASEPDAIPVTLLTVETVSARRRIEIPDDDSSFLLRAQARPLNAVGVHRDQRNHDQSFKCYAATYDEPVLNAGSDHIGGRYIRRCLVRYFPIDRTACVALQNADARKLDQRKGLSAVPETITVGQSSRPTPMLSSEFLRERHLCQRWIPRGTNRTQSILASNIMESADFNSAPRSGKAIDFVYRMSFFERPMIDLAGKHFTVHDSSLLGTHRSDASALELSDASLTSALALLNGKDHDDADRESNKSSVEWGPDGYPIIWMKFSRKEDDAQVEVKPYRVSFVRAALLVSATRHEAQLQNLLSCVRTGTAKKATKAMTEARLRPTLRLLEYAGHRSREKQSILLRDLKLGVNHIDREQLRRNGLLNPRYPTAIRGLSVSVNDAVMAEDLKNVELFGATGILFKIHCVAVVDIISDDWELVNDSSYKAPDGSLAKTVKEEWVVYRSFKDFQALHKQLKLQVALVESSGTSAGSRLVGAATAAFATGNGIPPRSRQRQALIPSLAQANKIGALGATKKAILKRKEVFDQYLKHILSQGHLLNRSVEILLFVGAFFPLSNDARPGRVILGNGDPLGRTAMCRTIVKVRMQAPDAKQVKNISSIVPSEKLMSSLTNVNASIESSEDCTEEADSRDQARKNRTPVMIPAIKNKIDKIPLATVRSRFFELLRFLFGFENASFIRNRMLAALKTASFAITSASEFRRTLYTSHTQYISAAALADWIKFGVESLWPNGVFYEASSLPTDEDLEKDRSKAKRILHENFPEQVRVILGQDLTRDGLNILHEMLQNRVVVRSMSYMLLDMLWLEVFPEIGDVLECGDALDIIEQQ